MYNNQELPDTGAYIQDYIMGSIEHEWEYSVFVHNLDDEIQIDAAVYGDINLKKDFPVFVEEITLSSLEILEELNLKLKKIHIVYAQNQNPEEPLLLFWSSENGIRGSITDYSEEGNLLQELSLYCDIEELFKYIN